MPYPRKFERLIELTEEEVEKPDYVWLNYSVCVVDSDSCGWGGWLLEAAYKKTPDRYPTGTGDRLLDIVDLQACPRCGRELFRTGVDLRMEPSEDQAPVHGMPGVDYQVAPIEYIDS